MNRNNVNVGMDVAARSEHAKEGGQRGRAPERNPAGFILRRNKIKTDTLLEDLRRFAQIRGGPFSAREFNAWQGRRCSSCAVTLRFGKWTHALVAAGIEGGHRREYSPEELLTHLAKVWQALGRPPGAVSLRKQGPIGEGPYARHWGSLRTACLKLARYHRDEISWEEALRPEKAGRRRDPLRPQLRWAVLERDGHRCRACGKTAADGVKLEVDHIIPVCAGGPDEMDNLWVLCHDCNLGKGGRTGGKTAA